MKTTIKSDIIIKAATVKADGFNKIIFQNTGVTTALLFNTFSVLSGHTFTLDAGYNGELFLNDIYISFKDDISGSPYTVKKLEILKFYPA